MIVYMGKKVKYVHIDEWDTWNMDSTLAHIILPMLKQLKETKQGAPAVELEDVPERLHPSSEQISIILQGETDDNYFKRWDYVLDEMIWAFQWSIVSWDSDDILGEYEEDEEYSERLSNGFRLFGKYYQSLWD